MILKSKQFFTFFHFSSSLLIRKRKSQYSLFLKNRNYSRKNAKILTYVSECRKKIKENRLFDTIK